MLSSNKFAFLVVAIILAISLASYPGHADELKADVVPADQVKPTKVATHSSLSIDNDSASSVSHHHYNSDAERAQDDLLITEVKSALANEGISEGYPVEVDADHGTVTLSGVVASIDQVKIAGRDAAAVPGVVAVKNQLQPHRK